MAFFFLFLIYITPAELYLVFLQYVGLRQRTNKQTNKTKAVGSFKTERMPRISESI